MGNISYILVVVDMQEHFLRYFNSDGYPEKSFVIENCKKLINKAMKDNNPIIFLEFKGCGETIPELSDLAKDYEHKYVGIKETCSGADQIKEIVDRYNLQSKYLMISGIWTDQCVLSSVSGLRSKYPDSHISVIANACGSQTKFQYDWAKTFIRENYGAKINTRIP